MKKRLLARDLSSVITFEDAAVQTAYRAGIATQTRSTVFVSVQKTLLLNWAKLVDNFGMILRLTSAKC